MKLTKEIDSLLEKTENLKYLQNQERNAWTYADAKKAGKHKEIEKVWRANSEWSKKAQDQSVADWKAGKGRFSVGGFK